jgi:hypothetical protein
MSMNGIEDLPFAVLASHTSKPESISNHIPITFDIPASGQGNPRIAYPEGAKHLDVIVVLSLPRTASLIQQAFFLPLPTLTVLSA